jgi:hypothetical protein
LTTGSGSGLSFFRIWILPIFSESLETIFWGKYT